jgi:hypothetical protein
VSGAQIPVDFVTQLSFFRLVFIQELMQGEMVDVPIKM